MVLHHKLCTGSRPNHTMEFNPFIKSQLASHNQLGGVMWCKFGHVTPERNPLTPLCGKVVGNVNAFISQNVFIN